LTGMNKERRVQTYGWASTELPSCVLRQRGGVGDYCEAEAQHALGFELTPDENWPMTMRSIDVHSARRSNMLQSINVVHDTMLSARRLSFRLCPLLESSVIRAGAGEVDCQ
jgi:hypothetical protein